ncbi:hypothetical protein [Streptomyces luteireticuli]|uniref:phage distal tail protein n=1 Tax=Streptomyces luteireticuli TaxID=173858 RepID=UPI0035590885
MRELQDWQLEVGDVLMGADTDILVSNIDGIGSPEMRTQDVEDPAGDGAFPGTDRYGPRTLRIEAGIRTPGRPAAALDLLAQLEQAVDTPAVRTTPGETAVLRIRWPGRETRRLYGRLRRVEATSTSHVLSGWIPLDIQFVALDPTFHDDTTRSITLPLDISGDKGGFRAPLVAPMTTGIATPADRPGWATNDGNRPACPALRITGPVSNPKITIGDTGRTLTLSTSLGPTETLDISTRPGTRWVLRNGAGNAAPDLHSSSRLDLFSLPPGRSEIRWTASDYTNTSRLQVTWQSAWAAL